MRQGSNNPNNRRGRGRGHHHAKRHNNNGNRNQNYDSNGPQGRIRGTAKQIHEKYLQQAKDAISSGDRILAESLFQHADHYGRLAAQFAPKPKPEFDENAAPAEGEGAEAPEAADAGEAVAETEPVSIEIIDGDEPADEAATSEETSEEEKPKRRLPRRGPGARRGPRKKTEDDGPKLGGGSSAVPAFLAQPVDVDGDEPAAPAAEAAPEEEEKPKRKPRKTTTRRKKTDEVEDAPSDDAESEAANA